MSENSINYTRNLLKHWLSSANFSGMLFILGKYIFPNTGTSKEDYKLQKIGLLDKTICSMYQNMLIREEYAAVAHFACILCKQTIILKIFTN